MRLLASAFSLAAALAAAFWLKPFEVHRAYLEARLRVGGVARTRVGTLAAYERNGCEAGAPCRCVALIHGLGDSALTWDDLLLGARGFPRPPAGLRFDAVELPGSEGSQAPAAGYSIPSLASDVHAALETACPRWTVVGNSLGGWIAADVALRWPGDVERLVLINAAGLDDPTGAAEATARTLDAPTVETMKEFSKRAYFKPPPAPERAWPALVASIMARPTSKICAALDKKDLLDKAASRIKAPTLVAWGLADRAVPVAVGRGWARLIKGARFAGLEDCGHLPQRECPAALAPVLYPDLIGSPR